MNFSFELFHSFALIFLVNLPDTPHCAYTTSIRSASQTGERSAYSFSATINSNKRF